MEPSLFLLVSFHHIKGGDLKLWRIVVVVVGFLFPTIVMMLLLLLL
jgi:hypothetical protein